MKLNQNKCILLGVNSLGSVQLPRWRIHADSRQGTILRYEYVGKH